MQHIIRVPMPDIPGECGDCGAASDEWPVAVYGNRVNVTCPVCFCIVAPVVAVQLSVASVAAMAAQLEPGDQDTLRDQINRAAETEIWGDEQ